MLWLPGGLSNFSFSKHSAPLPGDQEEMRWCGEKVTDERLEDGGGGGGGGLG